VLFNLRGLALTGAEHCFEDDKGQIEEQHGNLLCQNNARFPRAVPQSMLSESWNAFISYLITMRFAL